MAALDYEYGINTGNRFLDLVDHDEEPDEYIAKQKKEEEEKAKRLAKELKTAAKSAAKPAAAVTNANNVTVSSAKDNKKENTTSKSNTKDQKKQPSAFSNENDQAPRPDSGRGGRGNSRRGGSAGQDRSSYRGNNRGGFGNQSRPPRPNRDEGQNFNSENIGFEQVGEEGGNEGSSHEFRGRGRGRGGRGRGGRGGRGGFFDNRSFGDNNYEKSSPNKDVGRSDQKTDDSFTFDQPKSSRFQDSNPTDEGELGEKSFNSDNPRYGGRGGYRPRTFRNRQGFAGDRGHYGDREGSGPADDDNRRYRRQHDRERRNEISGVKAIEKKDGEGAGNWGRKTENPEDVPVEEETNEEVAPEETSAGKNWSQRVDEAEKHQLTLDEYKKQMEAKKKLNQEKLPTLKRRVANEGEDPKTWMEVQQVYQKRNDDDEVESEGETESEDEDAGNDDTQAGSKKKVITIPLFFSNVDIPRGGAGGPRGGPRRGSGRPRDRPNRSDRDAYELPHEQSGASEQTGDYSNEQRVRSSQRGGGRGSGPKENFVKTEYRRSYPNSNRGSRGGQYRSGGTSRTINLQDTEEFPSLSNEPKSNQ